MAGEDPASRNLLLDLLIPLGFEVETVDNGRAAVEFWRSWQPHLILMDIQMPIMDGCQATQVIKAEADRLSAEAAHRIEPKIIALTANAFEHDRRAALAAGCNDCLSKSAQNAVLLNKIAEQLGSQNQDATSAGSLRDIASPSNGVEIGPKHLSGQTFQVTDLAVMPQNWCQQLQVAAGLADTEQILALIEEIPDDFNSLASALRELVEGFQFEPLMALGRETDLL
ncbi:MAG: response regulator [Leptolyngbyaceae cyanobacterium]